MSRDRHQVELRERFVKNGKLVYQIAIFGITEEDIKMVNVDTRKTDVETGETEQFLFVRYQGEGNLTPEILRYEVTKSVKPEESEAEFDDGRLTVRLPLDEESILS